MLSWTQATNPNCRQSWLAKFEEPHLIHKTPDLNRNPAFRMNRQGAQDAQGQDLSPIHAVIEPDFRNERASLSRPFERIKPHLLSTPSSISWKRG